MLGKPSLVSPPPLNEHVEDPVHTILIRVETVPKLLRLGLVFTRYRHEKHEILMLS